jgi:hypothetical protein
MPAIFFYNPEIVPEPKSWLAMPEMERMRVIKNYHVESQIKLPNIKGHAALHTLVENQIATGYGPSRRAIARLLEEGLSRHEALHAIGSVITELYFNAAMSPQVGESEDHQTQLKNAIENLSAKQWKDKYSL